MAADQQDDAARAPELGALTGSAAPQLNGAPSSASAIRRILQHAADNAQHGPHSLACQSLAHAVGLVLDMLADQQRELEALRSAPAAAASMPVYQCTRCRFSTCCAAELDGGRRCLACLLSEVVLLRAECQVKSELIAKLTGTAAHRSESSAAEPPPAAINATPAMDARAASDEPQATRLKVVYIAAPLSAPDRNGIELNRAVAARWVAWATVVHRVAVSCSWITLAGQLSEEQGREFGLQCDKALIERCDEVWLVGGRVSEGMAIERDHAVKHGVPVIDWTWLGRTAPPFDAAEGGTDV